MKIVVTSDLPFTKLDTTDLSGQAYNADFVALRDCVYEENHV